MHLGKTRWSKKLWLQGTTTILWSDIYSWFWYFWWLKTNCHHKWNWHNQQLSWNTQGYRKTAYVTNLYKSTVIVSVIVWPHLDYFVCTCISVSCIVLWFFTLSLSLLCHLCQVMHMLYHDCSLLHCLSLCVCLALLYISYLSLHICWLCFQ